MGVVCEVLIVLKVSVPLQKFDQRPVHSSRHQTRRQVGGAVTSGLQTQQALGGEGAGQGWGGGGGRQGKRWGREGCVTQEDNHWHSEEVLQASSSFHFPSTHFPQHFHF